VAPRIEHPALDEFEITLIGTGGGYGETVLIHLGQRQWIIIDSCRDPRSGSILGLEYLISIGVNLASEVKLIICTHWDDDHIRGISELLAACKNAVFCISAVNNQEKFLQLVSLDFEKLNKLGAVTSSKEFMACLEVIEGREFPLRKAVQDKNLYSSVLNGQRIEVFSLSPSDESIRLYDYEIARLTSKFGAPERKLIQSPNEKSIVVMLKLGEHRAILGADLEVTGSNLTGWECILQNCTSIDKRSSYIKVSHHGSENGYHADIWTDLLESNPQSTITPWNKNKGLPQPSMVNKYKSHTSHLYITSDTKSSSPKKRSSDIEKALDRLGYKPREVRFYRGVIRSRIKQNETEWRTDLFDAAKRL
jgi:beta-lactamase superfamily II metal-dependent hydrolase